MAVGNEEQWPRPARPLRTDYVGSRVGAPGGLIRSPERRHHATPPELPPCHEATIKRGSLRRMPPKDRRSFHPRGAVKEMSNLWLKEMPPDTTCRVGLTFGSGRALMHGVAPHMAVK